MSKPSSFCTMCTHTEAFELIGLLLSISIYHPGSPVIIISDSRTKHIIEASTPQPNLKMKWVIMLNKYGHLNRHDMKNAGILHDFQIFNAVSIQQALLYYPDTLFLECDIIVTGVISSIDKSKDLGVSPQYMNKQATDVYGLYNSGMLWTKNKNIPKYWAKFTQTSRYYNQASIEDLVQNYSHFYFGENYNIHYGRIRHYPVDDIQDEKQTQEEKRKQEAKRKPAFVHNFAYNDKIKQVFYKNSQIKCIHTHLCDERFKELNNLFCQYFQMAKMYKVLAIMFRVIHGKWILRIPKQPMIGMAYHNGYSYRELARLIEKSNQDVQIMEDSKTVHCWLAPTTLLYDRRTLQWCNEELKHATGFFLGNGSMLEEGVWLQTQYPTLPVYPWIFWPRYPEIVEDIITNEDGLYYDERPIETIFIGNYENAIQKQYRMKEDWYKVIEEFHCTSGPQHKFTPREYLEKLGQAKFGLCLRGEGPKCHREIELMALGTVPIVTPGVCIDSYLNPPQENVHYIRVNCPAELRGKLETIDKETWEEMSDACCDWYQENCIFIQRRSKDHLRTW